MNAEMLTREWKIITDLLPDDWQELARSTGALQRARNVRDPSTLLLLLLLHAGAGLSLRQAAARAQRIGLATISDVGLLKRLRVAGPWLHTLAVRMFAESPFRSSVTAVPAQYRVRVVDATHVREPGSTGTNWRIHYVLRLPSIECDYFEVTDPSGGETFKRLPVSPGDLILGDRGYAQRAGVAHVVDAKGEVIVRLNSTSFPLMTSDGKPFDLLQHARRTPEAEPADWSADFNYGGKRYHARLCMIRKSLTAADKAKERLRKEALRKQKQLRPQTLELSKYVVVLTTLPPAALSARDVLELYRARWQIEIAFKRLKSLLGAGHVPKYDPASARAWIHAKLLTTQLIERLSEEARLFSPWGYPLRTA